MKISECLNHATRSPRPRFEPITSRTRHIGPNASSKPQHRLRCSNSGQSKHRRCCLGFHKAAADKMLRAHPRSKRQLWATSLWNGTHVQHVADRRQLALLWPCHSFIALGITMWTLRTNVNLIFLIIFLCLHCALLCFNAVQNQTFSCHCHFFHSIVFVSVDTSVTSSVSGNHLSKSNTVGNISETTFTGLRCPKSFQTSRCVQCRARILVLLCSTTGHVVLFLVGP
jgi:hypothetical protein